MKNKFKKTYLFLKKIFIKDKNKKEKLQGLNCKKEDEDIIYSPYIITVKNNSKTKDHIVNLLGAAINTDHELKNFGNDKDIEISLPSNHSYWSFLIKTITYNIEVVKWRLEIDGINSEKQLQESIYVKIDDPYNGSFGKFPIYKPDKKEKIIEIVDENYSRLEFYYPMKIHQFTTMAFKILAGNTVMLLIFPNKYISFEQSEIDMVNNVE
jgi:hypothetical protein